MVYHFLLLSEENDNFRREIQINADSSFLALNDAILKAVGYDKTELTTFYLCDHDWNKEQEITLMDMGLGSSEYDSYIMEEAILEELLEDKKGRNLLFVFDMLSERAFFIELVDVLVGKSLDAPVLVTSEGKAPEQTSSYEFAATRSVGGQTDIFDDADDFGDDELDLSELDADGFGEFDESSLGSEY